MSINGQPEPVPTTVTPTEVVETTPVVTPQQEARANVYKQYESLYNIPQSEDTQPPVEDTKPVEVTDPNADLKAQIAAQEKIIADMRKQMEGFVTKPTPEPAPVVPEKHKMEQWVNILAAGNYDQAEEFFLEHFAPKLQKQIQPQLVQQSVEATNAEQKINEFITTFERDNADLLPVREYVAMGAERRLKIAQDEGKIKSPADFVREYQIAVTSEANDLRERFRLARSAGAQEALTTRREVLSATTLEPTGIQQPPPARQPEADMSPMSYLEQRRESMARNQGLRLRS